MPTELVPFSFQPSLHTASSGNKAIETGSSRERRITRISASFSEFSEWLNDGWVGGSINRCGCGYSRLLSLQTILGVGIEQDTKCMAIIKVIMFIAANDIGGREKPGYHT